LGRLIRRPDDDSKESKHVALIPECTRN